MQSSPCVCTYWALCTALHQPCVEPSSCIYGPYTWLSDNVIRYSAWKVCGKLCACQALQWVSGFDGCGNRRRFASAQFRKIISILTFEPLASSVDFNARAAVEVVIGGIVAIEASVIVRFERNLSKFLATLCAHNARALRQLLTIARGQVVVVRPRLVPWLLAQGPPIFDA